jgi:hypothetical protein
VPVTAYIHRHIGGETAICRNNKKYVMNTVEHNECRWCYLLTIIVSDNNMAIIRSNITSSIGEISSHNHLTWCVVTHTIRQTGKAAPPKSWVRNTSSVNAISTKNILPLCFRKKMCSYVCLIFWLLCMFRSLYSVCCFCVNVYCTTATGCQPNCS